MVTVTAMAMPIPHILFVDDSPGFLTTCELVAKEFFKERFVLHTVNVRDDTPAWVARRLGNEDPLDAIYIDENMPRLRGPELLKNLRDAIPGAKYIPMVVMTAHLDTMDETAAMEEGALRYVAKFVEKGGEDDAFRLFLQEVATSFTQLRGQMEDQVWSEVTGAIADRMARRESVTPIAEWVSDFLRDHFGGCNLLLWHEDGRKPYGASGGTAIPGPLKANSPLVKAFLDPDGPTRLGRDLEGLPPKLQKSAISGFVKNHPLMMMPITDLGQSRRIGVLALWRDKSRHFFRRKDETFLGYMALQFATILGAERERRRIRERQTKLAEFVLKVSGAIVEDDVTEHLVQYLHEEVNGADDERTKTTIRLVDVGKATIPKKARRGLATTEEEDRKVDEFYNARSVHARVIRDRRSVRHDDVPSQAGENFIHTYPGIRSCLTVPLLSSGLCLGSVNLESLDPARYSESDQLFTEAVSGAAATVLVNLRAQQFLRGLLDLVNAVVGIREAKAVDQLMRDAFKLLNRFSGYARLLYVLPGDPGKPWQVKLVADANGYVVDESERLSWDNHTKDKWEKTYLARTLGRRPDGPFYTESEHEYANDDALNIKTMAEQVIHVPFVGRRSSADTPMGMLALLFLLKGAVNPVQRDLLNLFGQFTGALVQIETDIREIMEGREIERQQAALGMVLSQFRHTLRTRLGTVGNQLAFARQEGITGDWIDKAQKTLQEVGREMDSNKQLVKVPEFKDFDVATLVEDVIRPFAPLAADRDVVLIPYDGRRDINWRSDPQIVRMILENLVQNAVQSCRPGDKVAIKVDVNDKQLVLRVEDSGPGVVPGIREKLFQLGVTTRSSGTGFGLFYSRHRAKDISGELTYCPGASAGAIFSLTLPLIP